MPSTTPAELLARAWNALFSSLLTSFGFSQFIVDPAGFTITRVDLLYNLAVYVDVGILVGGNGSFIPS